MKNRKELFFQNFLGKIILTSVLIIGGVTNASALEFSDIGGRDDTKAIEFLKEQNVVQGYEKNQYKPNRKISRAEFLKILLETSVAEKKTCTKTEVQNIQKIFSDVSPDEWFAEYICTGYNSGFVNGYPDKTFKPQQAISLAEASKIVALAQEIDTSSKKVDEWFTPFLETFKEEKVLNQKKMHDPSTAISRGDMADMIWRITTGHEIFPENIKNIPQDIVSCKILEKEIIKANKRSGNFRNFRDWGEPVSEDTAIFNEAVAPRIMMKTADTASSGKTKSASFSENSTGSSDFSTTNIQEKGVDEADIIKNDGTHIFSARGEDVKIVRAYPISEMKEESTIQVKGMHISELFLDGDTLILLGNKSNTYDSGTPEILNSKMIAHSDYFGGSGIEVRIFDVSDRKNPKQTRSVSLNGNLVSSRRVGDSLYLVANNYLNNYNFNPEILPMMRDNSSEISVAPRCGNIQYFPNFTTSNLTTIAAINTKNPNKKITLKNFLGAGENIYASPENLYVVKNSSEQVFNDENGIAEWGWKNISVISKIALDAENIRFTAQGKVEGRVLNQYAMSEFENHFRIATQKGEAWNQEESENLVTILDANLKKTGEIRNIANGENTKSVRFMGKRGFLVTFKTVDPLFVLDLNPNNPKILGKLKIPGWSDYLHPIDDNYIIGFGKEVDESIDADKVHSDNAVYYTAVLGMKLSIFDVSDLNNPKEIQKIVIGDRGTESEILNNPRALFYDANRKLIGFPITIQKKTTSENGYQNTKTVFAGAQVYKFSIENGFTKLGEISHFPEYSKNFWDQNYRISRIVRIGENFYSSSKGLITGLSAEMKPEKTVSFIKAKKCSEISNASECSQNSQCKALYTNSVCPIGAYCILPAQFDRCVEK